MLLQTNSYIVPKDKRAAHSHLMQRFRQVLMKIGCDHFECYEQVGANWASGETSGRFVQLMRFRDRKHQQAVQLAEKKDPAAQALVREFCELINFPYQEQQGLFAHGYYQAVIDPIRIKPSELAFHASTDMEEPQMPISIEDPGELGRSGPPEASIDAFSGKKSKEDDPVDQPAEEPAEPTT